MSYEFDRDRERVLRDLNEARDELRGTVEALTDRDLDKGQAGSASDSSLSSETPLYGLDGPDGGRWVVRTVVEHLVLTDGGIAAAIAQRKDSSLPSIDDTYGRILGEAPPIPSVVDAINALDRGRQSILAACDGIDEETFYEMKPVREGDELCSPLTWLEHVANHDREHQQQLQELLHGGRAG